MDKTKEKKRKKPLRRAQRWGAQVPGMAFRLVGLLVAIIIMGLMFSALQAIEAVWLRILLSVLILTGMLLLCMNEGLAKGATDAAASRSYDSYLERGLAVSEKEDAACYQPLKAVAAALIVFILPMALACYVAATAKEYTYALQDLPAWVTQSYGARADVMAPLAAYSVESAIETNDVLRMLARLPEMMYINLFSHPLEMSAAIDRLSPLFVATYPLVYVLGYLRGPAVNRKREKENRRAKKIAVRKAQKKGLAEELTGSQMQVHYGQRADQSKHKKKELV